MTRRRAVALAAATLAAACAPGGPIDAADVLRVAVPESDVDLGRAFPVTVVRTWPGDAQAGDFGEESLFPLVLRTESRTQRESGGRVEETIRFRGYAFTPGDVDVAAPSFETSTPGGTRRTVAGESLSLRVRPALPETDDGAPELPAIPDDPWRARAVRAAAVAVAAVAALVAMRVRRRRAADPPVTPASTRAAVPADRPEWLGARERLARLRAATPDGRDAVTVFHVEAAALLREYVAETWDVVTDRRTTEEIVESLAGVEGLPAPERARLDGSLAACDFVKFTQDVPGAPARGRLLDDIDAFLVATRGGAA